MYIILELPPPSSNHAPKGFQKKKSYQLSSWVFDLRSIFRNMSMAATGRPTVFHWSGKVPWSQQLRSWTRTRVLSFKKVKDSNWFHIFVFCDNIWITISKIYIYILYIYNIDVCFSIFSQVSSRHSRESRHITTTTSASHVPLFASQLVPFTFIGPSKSRLLCWGQILRISMPLAVDLGWNIIFMEI